MKTYTAIQHRAMHIAHLLNIKENVSERPSCYAASLILTNRIMKGAFLRALQTIEAPTGSDLLAVHLMQRESAWKENELYLRRDQ